MGLIYKICKATPFLTHKGILPDFVWRALPELSKFEFFAVSSLLKSTFPQRNKTKQNKTKASKQSNTYVGSHDSSPEDLMV